MSYATAHDLLRRWLRADVGETDDPTLEAETTTWMSEHPLPVIADDEATLKACSDLVILESEEGVLRFGAGAVALVAAEWTRRQNRARAAQFRRGMERAAPELARAIGAGWRRLESNR